MKYLSFFFVPLFIALLFSSCDWFTSPEELTPGRRDYVWTADTIHVPFTYFEKIWGDSNDNVWIVGPGGGLKTTVWNYDGTQWTTDSVSKGVSPLGIWRFGKNDIWIAGNEGNICHFNGSQWSERIKIEKENSTIGFQEIWGDSPNNVFAVGYADSSNTRKPIIFNWDGYNWAEIEIPIFPTYNFILMRGGKNNKFYLLGWGAKENGGDLLAIFQFDGTQIEKIYEGDFLSDSWANFENINNRIFFVIGNNICTYKDGGFEVLVAINNTNFNQGLAGRSEKDIFLNMRDGIAHYNGSDIEYLYHFLGSEKPYGMVAIQNYIFVLINDFENGNNIILRGESPLNSITLYVETSSNLIYQSHLFCNKKTNPEKQGLGFYFLSV